jgi:hypothetical protein
MNYILKKETHSKTHGLIQQYFKGIFSSGLIDFGIGKHDSILFKSVADALEFNKKYLLNSKVVCI